MINKLYKWAETGFLKRAANSTIHIESAIRGEKKGKEISSEVKRESTVFSVKNIKDWKAAVAIASDPENPSFELLADLYTHLKLDNHLVAAIETRIYRVLRSLYVFKNEKGEVNHNLRTKFDRPWFEKFISIAIWSLFSGVKVAELGNLDEHLELIQVNEIPMQNTIPKKGIIIKQVGDTTGWNYKEGAFSPYYIQIGANDQLGDLVNLTPMILSKKLAMGSWLDFIEKYGVPQIWITTDREDPDRFDELFEMAINMRSNNVAVLRGKEKIESGDVSQGDAYKTFKELISLVNSEISKRVLGQDGTTDAKDVSGNYGSLKILQEVANDRHESDKLFIENLINKELIPRLMKLSSFYSDLQGHYFDWDDTEQMKKEEFIDNVVKLEGAGFELDLDQISEKTGLSIKGRKNTTEEVEPIKKKLNTTANLISAHYHNKHSCGHNIEPEAINIGSWSATISRITKGLFKGKLKASNLDQELISKTYKELDTAADSGYGDSYTSDENVHTKAVTKLQKNLYLFSAAKSYQQLTEMNNKLVDENGKIRSYNDFKKRSSKGSQELQ
ncbi:DUF935 family protein [Tenacibaculum maritimum]|nr:DUF935 family protein [Tenacibaculum maritimum]